MTIWSHLAEHDVAPTEGSVTEAEIAFLTDLASQPEIERIAEIGFNAGVSADTFLRANDRVQVLSFDIGDHSYVDVAKRYIDRTFSGRHQLVIGNSKSTVPEFATNNPWIWFDVIFIDGGHDYGTAAADIRNARQLSHGETVVIMDDLQPWLTYGIGPACAWYEAVATGVIRQEGLFQDGRQVREIERPAERAWGIGRYQVDAESTEPVVRS